MHSGTIVTITKYMEGSKKITSIDRPEIKGLNRILKNSGDYWLLNSKLVVRLLIRILNYDHFLHPPTH